MDRGEKPFIKEWGEQSAPKWSPDGRKIAFVSTRTDHSFVVVYDMATRTVKYMSPSVDFDTSPMWSADSKQHRLRPSARACRSVSRRSRAPAARAAERSGVPADGARRTRSGSRRPRSGERTGSAARGDTSADPRLPVDRAAAGRDRRSEPGVESARAHARDVQGRLHAVDLEGGRRDRRSAGGLAQRARTIRSSRHLANPRLAGDYFVFPRTWSAADAAAAARGEPPDAEQPPAARAARLTSGTATTRSTSSSADSKPVLLTTTDGLIEDQTSVALSADGKTLYYCTNAKRHRAAAHLGGAGGRRDAASRSRRGDGIETYPAPLASGKHAGDAQRRLEDAAVARRLAARRDGVGRRRRRSSSRRRAQGFPMRRARRAGDRASPRPPTGSRSTTSCSCRRISSRARSGRRSSSCTAARCGRCCSATTTCSSTTGPTASISGSRARATS